VSRDVLDMIDRAIWAVEDGADAMRWTPEPPKPEPHRELTQAVRAFTDLAAALDRAMPEIVRAFTNLAAAFADAHAGIASLVAEVDRQVDAKTRQAQRRALLHGRRRRW